MLLSHQEHKKAILGTVTSRDFITEGARADRAKRAKAVEAGPVHEGIHEAESALDEGATLCDMSACPEQLAGRIRSPHTNAPKASRCYQWTGVAQDKCWPGNALPLIHTQTHLVFRAFLHSIGSRQRFAAQRYFSLYASSKSSK
jgi:hypothetical protein